MLNALSGMAEPIQSGRKQLEAVRESLVALAPTLTTSMLTALGTTVLGGVITGGISFASKSENLLNMRVGTINQSAETFTNASSYVSLGFCDGWGMGCCSRQDGWRQDNLSA